MLKIEKINKTYKKNKLKALSNISFNISQGEFVALLGANGAGKTTLLNILTGIVTPESGEIHLDGSSLISGPKLIKIRLGIVPQELVFDFIFTVEETLRLYAGYYGLRNVEDHIQYLLKRLSLYDKRNMTVRTLSGGMKRRLMIARALVHKPDILLLDEPTAGVDVMLRQDMYQFLDELHKQGLTIILTTHYLEEAEKLCSRIIMLKEGKVIADRDKSDFLLSGGTHVNVDLTFHNQSDLHLFKGASQLKFIESDGLWATLSLKRNEMQNMFMNLSKLDKGIKEIRINPPKLEDIFLKLS